MWTIFFILSGLSDNVLKPLLLGKGAMVSMLVIFIGLIGGFMMSGFIRFFVGSIVFFIGYKLFATWMNNDQPENSIIYLGRDPMWLFPDHRSESFLHATFGRAFRYNLLTQKMVKRIFTAIPHAKCTKNKKGRLIERSQYADLIFDNKVRIENNYEMYRKRQTIVEHPYDVIKRQWDFYYIMTKKTIKHASAYVGLIFTAYNLRRIFNLIDQNT